MEQQTQTGYNDPDWARRAEHIDHKPEFVDGIPDRLKSLGQVFFPIPRAKKGHSYPHHKDEYRYSWDSEVLNAYLESGSNYGIACAEDLVVLDIDDMEYASLILKDLPQSLHQITGSGEGVHVFYKVDGFNKGASLKTKEEKHGVSNKEVGDVKGHVHSYVVGPGSIHPSGNEYGPLAGEEIVEVNRGQIESVIDEFSGDGDEAQTSNINWEEVDDTDVHSFYSLTADEVAPGMSRGERSSNPFHGSSTGTNFMKNEDGETFVCWRCSAGSGEGCVLSGIHYLAAEYLDDELSNYHCEHVRGRWQSDPELHYYSWRVGVEKGVVDGENPPFNVVFGYGLDNDAVVSESDLNPETYNKLEEELKYMALSLRSETH